VLVNSHAKQLTERCRRHLTVYKRLLDFSFIWKHFVHRMILIHVLHRHSNTKIKPSWTNIMISVLNDTESRRKHTRSKECTPPCIAAKQLDFICPHWVRQEQQSDVEGSTRENIWHHISLKHVALYPVLLHSWEFAPHTQEQATKIQLNELNCHAGDGEQHCYFVQKHVKVLTWTWALLSFEAAHSY
jgi:hypothetical protein